jgi:serine/threonine protein kinase
MSTQEAPLEPVAPAVDAPPLPVALGDFLLACLVEGKALAVRLAPEEGGHKIVFEGGTSPALVSVSWEIGDALAVRLALLAGIDVVASGSRLGRAWVRHQGRRAEVLVVLTTSQQGLALELRRVVDESLRPPRRPGAPGVPGAGALDFRRIDAYRLYEELGRGGTGVVYCAEHQALEKLVALKILHPEIGAAPETAAMLLREGRAASRVRHPGIVDVTDFGTAEDGRMFLVMELVTWPTMQATIARGPITPERAVIITRNLLAALEAAHTEGLVHRDLKPSNVFIGPDDRIKLTDFGSAVALAGRPPLDGGGHTIPFWGTAEYMAPEHYTGSFDRRSDVYAVGCILHFLLTRRVPFSAPAAVEVAKMHARAPVPPLVLPDGAAAPPLLEAVVRRALAKSPKDRYQTAVEMARDLERVSVGLSRRGWQRWLPL